MLELAHFTSEELPGTIAIWLAGVGFGVLLARVFWSGRAADDDARPRLD